MWQLTLMCAVGITCGLKEPLTRDVQYESEQYCLSVGKLAIDLSGRDRRKFRILCDRVANDRH